MTPQRGTHDLQPVTEIRVVDVYPYRFTEGELQFLLLRRAPKKVYAGSWRMAGGKILSGETAWRAAWREAQEETGQTPRVLWSVPSMNSFYEWQHDRVNLIPAFAAELVDDPVVDAEHDDWAWLQEEEAVSRLRWPEQQRLVKLVARMLREGVPPELIVSVPKEPDSLNG